MWRGKNKCGEELIFLEILEIFLEDRLDEEVCIDWKD